MITLPIITPNHTHTPEFRSHPPTQTIIFRNQRTFLPTPEIPSTSTTKTIYFELLNENELMPLTPAPIFPPERERERRELTRELNASASIPIIFATSLIYAPNDKDDWIPYWIWCLLSTEKGVSIFIWHPLCESSPFWGGSMATRNAGRSNCFRHSGDFD